MNDPEEPQINSGVLVVQGCTTKINDAKPLIL